MPDLTLTVGGMTCAGCARHVTEALGALTGVAAAVVPGWESGRADVTLAADSPASSQDLVAAFDGVETTGRVADFGAVLAQVRALVADLRQAKYVDVVSDDAIDRVAGSSPTTSVCPLPFLPPHRGTVGGGPPRACHLRD